jgi:ClpP class serine protease
LYRDDVEKQFKKHAWLQRSDPLIAVRRNDYRDVSPESLGLNKGERIAVIYASGEIGSGSSQNSPSGDQSIGSDTVAKALNDAAATRRSRRSCCASIVPAVPGSRRTSSGTQSKRRIRRSRWSCR